MEAKQWRFQLFVCLGLHMFHYPLYLKHPRGNWDTLYPGSFLPKRTGADRNPLISTKYTSKTLSGVNVCAHIHTHVHANTLCVNL